MSLLSARRCARNFGQTTAQESKKIHFRWPWVARKRFCLSPLVKVNNNDNLTTGTLTTRIAKDRLLFAHRRGDLCIHEALRNLHYHWSLKTHLLLFLGVGAFFGSFICFFISQYNSLFWVLVEAPAISLTCFFGHQQRIMENYLNKNIASRWHPKGLEYLLNQIICSVNQHNYRKKTFTFWLWKQQNQSLPVWLCNDVQTDSDKYSTTKAKPLVIAFHPHFQK